MIALRAAIAIVALLWMTTPSSPAAPSEAVLSQPGPSQPGPSQTGPSQTGPSPSAALTAAPPGSNNAEANTITPSFRIVAQTALPGPGNVHRVLVGVGDLEDDPAPETLEITATVHQQVTTRSQFQQTVAGRLGSVRSFVRQSVPSRSEWFPNVNLDASGRVLMGVDVRLNDRADGTYPVHLELRDGEGGKTFDAQTTYITASGTRQGLPLDVALVLDMRQPVQREQPAEPASNDGVVPVATSDLSTLASPIAVTIDRLIANPATPVTIRVTGETLHTLRERDPGLLERFRAAIVGREVLAGPYVDPEPTTLDDPSMVGEIRRLLQAGADTIGQTLGVAGAEGTYLSDDATRSPSRAALRALGARRVVLANAALAPSPGAPIDRLTTFDSGANEGIVAVGLPLAVLDPELEARFDNSGRPGRDVLHVLQLLGELTVMQQQAPSRRRGIVVVVPAESVTADSLDALLVGLDVTSRLRPVTLSTLFEQPAARDRSDALIARRAALGPRIGEGVSLSESANWSELRVLRQRVDGFASLFTQTPALAEVLDERLLTSMAAELSTEERAAILDEVRQAVDAQLGRIRVNAGNFVFTARQGQIPLTFTNDFDEPVKVRITLESDRVELGSPGTFEFGKGVTTLYPKAATREPGKFPIRVAMTAPNGLELQQTAITLRSTAASWVGRVLTGGALAVLGLWWTRTIARARRQQARHRHPTVPPEHREQSDHSQPLDDNRRESDDDPVVVDQQHAPLNGAGGSTVVPSSAGGVPARDDEHPTAADPFPATPRARR